VLLLGAIILAIFVLPSPWGIVAVVGGGLVDIGESLILLRWSRRRRAVTGVEALVGQKAVVSSPGQVKVAGELWEARSAEALSLGDEVQVDAVDGLTLVVSRLSPAPRSPQR
jgi:membrane-bound serine protease (ClpP class)